MHKRLWSWTVAPFRRPWGGFECFERHQSCVGEVSIYFNFKECHPRCACETYICWK